VVELAGSLKANRKEAEVSDLTVRRVLPRANRRTYARCAGDHIGEVIDGSVGGSWLCGNCGEWNHTNSTHACQFVPFVHEHLGHEPVQINSWKEYRSHLQANGWHNELAD